MVEPFCSIYGEGIQKAQGMMVFADVIGSGAAGDPPIGNALFMLNRSYHAG
jgi:hypothetical protein